jgi:glycosyltransferase involved in cell wall biosynthesis
MPVFNAEPFVRRAVDSVREQTFSDWELLVIDDGSTDGSLGVLQTFAEPRLRIERNRRNLGVTRSLNRGLALARGELVARLDGDDVAYPDRLRRQVLHLDAHPEVALVGSWADLVDASGRPFMREETPTANDEIQARILRGNCFVHASTMFRRQAALDLGGYDEALREAQDYDLWLRLSEHHQVANLGEPLIAFRVHGGQVSQRRLRSQRAFAERARAAAVQRRTARGLLPPGHHAPEPGPWARLRAAPGTVGGDYLYWAETHRRMGAPARAAILALAALVRSPLAGRAYRILAACLARGARARGIASYLVGETRACAR